MSFMPYEHYDITISRYSQGEVQPFQGDVKVASEHDGRA